MVMKMNNNNDLSKQISDGIIDAKNYGNGAGLALMEILVISISTGVYFASWWIFGGLLFGLLFLMFIKTTKILLLVIFTIAWVLIAWAIGQWFGSIGASVVLSVIALVISSFLHLQAFIEWKVNTKSKK